MQSNPPPAATPKNIANLPNKTIHSHRMPDFDSAVNTSVPTLRTPQQRTTHGLSVPQPTHHVPHAFPNPIPAQHDLSFPDARRQLPTCPAPHTKRPPRDVAQGSPLQGAAFLLTAPASGLSRVLCCDGAMSGSLSRGFRGEHGALLWHAGGCQPLWHRRKGARQSDWHPWARGCVCARFEGSRHAFAVRLGMRWKVDGGGVLDGGWRDVVERFQGWRWLRWDWR